MLDQASMCVGLDYLWICACMSLDVKMLPVKSGAMLVYLAHVPVL